MYTLLYINNIPIYNSELFIFYISNGFKKLKYILKIIPGKIM